MPDGQKPETREPKPLRVGSVAVVGRPNAGKSTLVNALVGEKVAIVSDKPQTTRRRILGVARRPGAEIALIDTPGIHKPEYRMNAAMVRDATDALASADLVLFVVDAASERGTGERYIVDLIEKAGVPAVLALNKIDRIRKEKLLPLTSELTARHAFAEVVPVSARTGDNVERLFGILASRLPEGDAAYPDDFLTSTPETEWIAEVIREKLLERTRDELPFAHAVLVDSVREAEGKDITVVTASIVVEREGQKGIVVGKGGAMIRDIGRAAREELEQELGRRLYLDLTVRVKPDWRNDEGFLSRLRAGEER
jgi:GTP-binding protein Era